MKHFLIVFLGGGLGSGLRFLISRTLNPFIQHFFLGTFLANLLGCILIGFLMGSVFHRQLLNTSQVLFFATGFCGGFTTFSTFSLEQYQFLKEGAYVPFIIYTLLSLVLGILGVMGGYWLSRQF